MISLMPFSKHDSSTHGNLNGLPNQATRKWKISLEVVKMRLEIEKVGVGRKKLRKTVKFG